MPWRSDLSPLFPGVERSGAGPRSLLTHRSAGPRVPADASRAPGFASATTLAADADRAPVAGVPAQRPAQTSSGTPATPAECGHPYCAMPAGRNVRGYCDAHNDGYLTAAYELTQEIGRGELP